jgi:hypothetical protein
MITVGEGRDTHCIEIFSGMRVEVLERRLVTGSGYNHVSM